VSETTTDANGQYSLKLDPGLYDVEFIKEPYISQKFENVEIIAGKETVQDAVMTVPKGWLKGTVKDETGKPIEGVLVRATKK
jgi:protocatechuate 3,4-dioxygenase beta subunit